MSLILTTNRTNALAFFRAERFNRKCQVQLLQDDFSQVYLAVLIKKISQILSPQLFLDDIKLFWKIDKVKGGIHRKFKGNQAAAAYKTEASFYSSLNPNFISDFFYIHISMNRLEENRTLFHQV